MRTAVLVLGLLALCGCSGDSAGQPTITEEEGAGLVLARADLGSGFLQFDEGRQVQADHAPPRDDPTRFGRIDGWKARYRRSGTAAGPLVVESRVDVFGDEDGAREDFDLYREALAELAAGAGGAEVEDGPELGEETITTRYRQGARPNAVTYYTIAWRLDNATASLLVSGFRLKLAEAVALARKQHARIERAAS